MLHARMTTAQTCSVEPFNTSARQAFTRAATSRKLRKVTSACHSNQQPAEQSQQHTDRRQILSAALGFASMQLFEIQLAHAADTAPAGATTPVKLTRFDGKAGYTFEYPDSWIEGFNRRDRAGALALVGDFKTFDTTSVQKVDTARLNLPESAVASRDVKALANAMIEEVRNTGSTMGFELVNEGTARKDGSPYVTFEYVLSICKGEVEEGLEGVRRCLGPNGSPIEPITRHLLAAATFRNGQAYLLTASATVERWPEVAEQLRAVADSFQMA